MFDFLALNFRRGVARLREHPQLVYTVLVAGTIVAAFLFIALQFAGIARDAQERLINVRIGSIQDATAEFAGDLFENPTRLQHAIEAIAAGNETIRTFYVVSFSTTSPRIIASLQKARIGEEDLLHNFLYMIAKTNPAHSFTQEGVRTDGRVYQTVRAVTDNGGTVIGALYTEETLSEADRIIESNIRTSFLVFTGIILLILALFFRHAKMIDYIALYQKLKEVDQLKDDFIAMASHELRTPLAAIRGYADLAKDASELKAATREQVERIEISARQLDQLVEDMLDVSRLEQGRMKFEFTTVPLDQSVQTVLTTLLPVAADKKLFLRSNVPLGMTVHADPTRLVQILTNIVGNAIKYTKQGGITISSEKTEAHVTLRVSDTGLGISAADQKKLFEKFYRVKTAETSSIRGTGLGLWITKTLVEKMNGTIAVESILGKGTDVIVTLPKA